MFISVCLADGSMAERPHGTESQKVKGLTGKKTVGKKNKNIWTLQKTSLQKRSFCFFGLQRFS